jgi:hypothetical protein
MQFKIIKSYSNNKDHLPGPWKDSRARFFVYVLLFTALFFISMVRVKLLHSSTGTAEGTLIPAGF